MKILLVEYSGFGGHAHYVALLTNHLKKQKCNISILSKKRKTELEKLVKVPYYTGSLYNMILNKKIDVVHFFQSFHFYKSIPFLLKNKFTNKVKTVYTIHNYKLHEIKTIKALVFFILQYIVLFLVDHIIVHSEYTKKKLKIKYLVDKTSVVYHGHYGWFDKKRFTRVNARKKLKINKDAFVIVFFGSVRKYKGVEYLVEAVKGMKNVVLLIAGKVWDDMKKYMEKAKDFDFIKLYDELIPNNEIELYYKAANIAVFPYKNITTSGALTVAMGLKTPIITTNIDVMPEIVGDVALLVPPNNPTAIREAIERLRHDKNLMKKLAKKAYKKAITKYSWNKSAKKTYKIYKKLLYC